MFKLIKYILILLLSSSVLAGNAVECGNECQEAVVEKYFKHLSEIYRKGSQVSHIEKLFSILSQDVRYEHLVYGASFDHREWKEAFLRNQKAGAYKNEHNQKIRVENYIHGKGYVAVAYSYGVDEKTGAWAPKGDQMLMALFSLENGKITTVKEYW